MNQDFLFELGCEELPAGELAPMAEHLQANVKKALDAAKLQYGDVKVFYTPRRLALSIKALQVETLAQVIERRGPAKNAPAQAIEGFLKSCNAKREDLIEVETDKGTWLAVKLNQPAVSAKVILKDAIETAIKTMPLKKAMRWGNHDFAFLRPVHWIVALLGEEIVPIAMFGLKAESKTFGHRFHHPEAVTLKHPQEYVDALRKAYVMVDREERRATILTKTKQHACRLGKLEEVLDLVEWPVPLLCTFEKEFLSVPQEVLITTMEANQRVFPVVDQQGKLQNQFWVVANIDSKDPQSVIHGNEKVVRARLSDAKFFYDEDLKVPLENHLEGLKKITFQQGLGSLYDKVERLKAIAKDYAQRLELDESIAVRAAELCKTDLVTQMVQEFPELQGYMGEQYARAQGESEDVAIAIREHYLPNSRGSKLPTNIYGALLALFDKLDTLTGLFIIGQKPTSSSDPFALRRQAMGIASILREQGMKNRDWENTLIKEIVNALVKLYQNQKVKVQGVFNISDEIDAFVFERAKYAYLEDYPNINTRFIEAVESSCKASVVAFQPALFHKRIISLSEAPSDRLKKLKELYDRINNILNSNKEDYPDRSVHSSHCENELEKELINKVENLNEKISRECYEDHYAQGLQLALDLIDPIAQFFENFMVMAENKDWRRNRLNLLNQTRRALLEIADFSKL